MQCPKLLYLFNMITYRNICLCVTKNKIKKSNNAKYILFGCANQSKHKIKL